MSYMGGAATFNQAGIQELPLDMLDLVDGGSVNSVATHVATIAAIGAGGAAIMGAEPIAIGLGVIAGGAAIVAGLTS